MDDAASVSRYFATTRLCSSLLLWDLESGFSIFTVAEPLVPRADKRHCSSKNYLRASCLLLQILKDALIFVFIAPGKSEVTILVQLMAEVPQFVELFALLWTSQYHNEVQNGNGRAKIHHSGRIANFIAYVHYANWEPIVKSSPHYLWIHTF